MFRASRNVAAAILLSALAAVAPVRAQSQAVCASDSSCPDLAIRPLGPPSFADGGRTLVLRVEVENQGTADAPASTVGVSALTPPSWDVPPTDVPALAANGGLVDLELRLTVPDAARGHGQAFTVTADPADTVDELDEGNNTFRTKAFFPAGDLRVEIDASSLADGGRTLVLATTVVNDGKGPTAPTSLQAAAAGWTDGTAQVASIDPLGRVSVDVRIPIPDSARGRTATLTATVDPAHDIAETSYENNASGPFDVSIGAGDLTADIVGRQPSGDRSRLLLEVRVTNTGTAPTAATTVRAAAGGWGSGTSQVPSLNGGGTASVTIGLDVPAGAAGTTTSFVATVDPAHDIAETSYLNNESQPFFVTIEAQPPATKPPDLTVSIARQALRDLRLTLVLVVRNSGGGRSGETVVQVSAAGGPSARAVVPPLLAHSSRRVSVGLAVPDAARGRTLRFVAVVDPGHSVLESSYANNESSPIAVPVPPAPSGTAWGTWAGIGGGGAAALLALGFAGLRIRLRVRVRWQREAQEEEPPETCEVPETYVWRKHCKAKPALRRVERVELLARSEDDEQLQHEVGQEIVDRLDRAVHARRLRRGEEKLHDLLQPTAHAIARQAEEWLAVDGGDSVAVRVRLKGGKLECEFKRLKCVQRGPTCTWEERQSWTGEVEDEAEETVSVLSWPLPPEPVRSERLAQLEADLLALVEQIDLPDLGRAPQIAPIRQ